MTVSCAKDLVVCGSFGFGNAGDEALPLALSDLLDEIGMDDVSISLLTRFDAPDAELGNAIGLGPMYSKARAALKGATVIQAGGGIVEPNNFCVLARCREFLSSDFAAFSGLFGVNVESMVWYSPIWRWRIRRWLRDCGLLTVRDPMSARTFRRIIGKKRAVEVIGDVILGLKPAESLPAGLESLSPYMAVCLAPRWGETGSWIDWIAGELLRLARELGVNIVFVPMSIHHDDDRPVHRTVRQRMRELSSSSAMEMVCVEDVDDPRQLMAILGRSELTVSMRLHGCVLAYAAQTPFVGLGYHPKIWGFAEAVGFSNAVVPILRPNTRQSREAYGFSLADVNVNSGDLTRCALAVADSDDFSMRERLLTRQRDVMKGLLHRNLKPTAEGRE